MIPTEDRVPRDPAALLARLEALEEFASEYAWHARGCPATDPTGEGRAAACTCGFEQARAVLEAAR